MYMIYNILQCDIYMHLLWILFHLPAQSRTLSYLLSSLSASPTKQRYE